MIAEILEFKYSTNGVPYIDFGNGQLVLSRITSDPSKGYRYLAYNHRYIDFITLKKKTKGEVSRKQIKAENHDSCCFNMHFYTDAKHKKGIPRNSVIPVRLGEWLRKKFAGLIDDEGYLPFSKVKNLQGIINRANLDKILKTKLKRKRKKKNATT